MAVKRLAEGVSPLYEASAQYFKLEVYLTYYEEE